MKNKKGITAVVIALIAVAAVIIGAFYFTKPKTAAGDKNIAVTVVYGDKTSDKFEINTSQEFLRGALDEKDLIKGEESDMGFFMTTVNGVEANSAELEWWCVTKSGEAVMTGIDQTPIADGDNFEITLTVGY